MFKKIRTFLKILGTLQGDPHNSNVVFVHDFAWNTMLECTFRDFYLPNGAKRRLGTIDREEGFW